MILHELLRAMPGLVPIGAGVALLVLLGRDPKAADEHTVDDYRAEPVDAATRDVADALDLVGPPPAVRRRLRPGAALDILPPAPPGTTARLPLYAETLFASWRQGETPADAAARFLREIAAEEQAKAGIRPRSTHWRSDSGECWIGCPICDRDMTGAFPVVRVAA